jgi:hypothetical protein
MSLSSHQSANIHRTVSDQHFTKMFSKFAVASSLLAAVNAQGAGTQKTETHPKMSWQSCTSPSSCTTNNGEVVIGMFSTMCSDGASKQSLTMFQTPTGDGFTTRTATQTATPETNLTRPSAPITRAVPPTAFLTVLTTLAPTVQPRAGTPCRSSSSPRAQARTLAADSTLWSPLPSIRCLTC